MQESASKILVRLPAEVHSELKRLAVFEGKTLNEVCLEAFARRLSGGSATAATQFFDMPKLLASGLGPRLNAIVLFGSQARGEATGSSDIDLLLSLNPGQTLDRQLYRDWDDLGFGLSLSPHFVRIPESMEDAGGVWFEVALDGIVLWERDLVASKFLGKLRHFIVAGRVMRKESYGVPYWVKTHAESKAG